MNTGLSDKLSAFAASSHCPCAWVPGPALTGRPGMTCRGLLRGFHQRRLFEVTLGEPHTDLAHHFLVRRLARSGRHAHHRIVAIGRDHPAVTKDASGVFTSLDRPDATTDLVALYRDAAIRLA